MRLPLTAAIASLLVTFGTGCNKHRAAHPDLSDGGLVDAAPDTGAEEPTRDAAAHPPAPAGPPACPAREPLAPLDDGCTDEVCQVAIRLDYRTLGLRGWTVQGGPKVEVTSADVMRTAREVNTTHGMAVSGPPAISGPHAGVYVATVNPSDFGAFGLVGAQTGLVLTAGGVVWSGRGSYWLPSSWRPASDLVCGSSPVRPDETVVLGAGCNGFDGTPPQFDDNAALAVALRTNVAAHFASAGGFSAYVHVYLPSVGACNPDVAEFIVVLTRVRS